jgi:hypothetical protein
MCTHVGDPLYTPFGSTKYDDTTAPEFAYVTTRKGAVDSIRNLRITLNGRTPDKDVEVAQYKIEFGTTATYDSVIDFEWGWDDEPFLGYWEHETDRHFFFAREYDWTISGLSSNTEYHYRVTARDQCGNTTSTGDMVFNTSVECDTGFNWTAMTGYSFQAEVEKQIRLFPQPVTDRLTLQLPYGFKTEMVNIYAMTGRLVTTLWPVTGGSHYTWDLNSSSSPVPNGTYSASFNINGQVSIRRISIIR